MVHMEVVHHKWRRVRPDDSPRGATCECTVCGSLARDMSGCLDTDSMVSVRTLRVIDKRCDRVLARTILES